MESKTTFLFLVLCALETISASPLEGPLRTLVQQSFSRPALATSTNNQYPVSVQTTSGILNGAKQILNNVGGNISVYKFLSVPYAEAPIDKLRFQRPVEYQDRSSVEVDASKFGKTCPQFRHLTRFISPLLNIDDEHQTSEDCLHLNVFVPSSIGSVEHSENNRLEPNKQLPVIVWIPGEGFDFADARQFDGSYLAHKTQSIVVTVQYRVGILGFLHAPLFGIKGNMGVHDQIMALRWIKKNIGSFGGDSERVTVMGRFSGSMSVSAMITAPKQELIKLDDGRPLFNRVAMLSGIAVDNWIIDSQQHERIPKIVESALNKGLCSRTQVDDNSCLQSLPVDQLLPIAGYGWRLVVDNELVGKTDPIEAVGNNQFAAHLEGVLFGETGMEGTLCLYRHMLNTQNSNYAQLIEEDKLTRDDVYEIIRDDSATYFKYNLTSKQNPIQAALESMIEETPNEDRRLRDKYLNACSSYMVKSHSNRFKREILARNQLEENRVDSSRKMVEVFHYELKYKPTFSLAPDYIKTAAHGDDVPLIFGLVYNQPAREVSESDLLMSRKMMSYIGNFAHGSNPLLNQHQTISDASKPNDSEISSMDESEQVNSSPSEQLFSYIRRNWSSEGQVHPIDMNDCDQSEIMRKQAAKISGESSSAIVDNRQQQQNYMPKNNLRLFVLSKPQWFNSFGQEVQPVFDATGEQRGNPQPIYTDEPMIYGRLQQQRPQSDIMRYQHLEHQQQLLEENGPWYPVIKRNQKLVQTATASSQANQQQQSLVNMVHESSFLTMLLLTSCIFVFAMMTFCLGLCVMILRHGITGAQTKNQKQFASSSSSCNICEDSQGSSLDAVLTGGNKKDNRFCNVFAKLRSPAALAQCATSTSTANGRQPVQTELVLHQKATETTSNANSQ